MQRTDPPAQADELSTFSAFLDFQRATLLGKCEGLTDEQLRTTLAPSPLTLAGLLKHAALDEDSWFSQRFAGEPERAPWVGVDWDADPDWEFHSALDEPGEQLRALYQEACARSRAVVAAAGDGSALSVVPLRDGGAFSLRWVLGHMIEETARHNGHADFLREAIDGVTGE